MAQKRMFSLDVVDTDRFLDMSASAQALYFHLGMHGDDDGFVSSPKKIARSTGCNDDDLRLLAGKGFIIPFESGVIVITDWKRNNTLKNDRYHETIYLAEKSLLHSDPTGKYLLASNLEPSCIQAGNETEPEHSVAELSETKEKKVEAVTPLSLSRFVPPTIEEVKAYCLERGNKVDPQRFVDFYTANGWMRGKNRIKDWKACVRTWESNDRANKSGTKTVNIPGVMEV